MEINIQKFYNIGAICFAVIAVMNTITFAFNFLNGNFVYETEIVSSIASLVFNYALFGFFVYLKSTLPPGNLQKGTEDDMLELLGGKKL